MNPFTLPYDILTHKLTNHRNLNHTEPFLHAFYLVIMAKTIVTVTYTHPGAQPPVYLAGSFTDWQPLEMDTEEVNGEYHFHKQVSVEEGHQFQYKFRLGPGDWWVLNESSPIGMYDLRREAFLV
jgi:hypothetical protein